MLVLGALAPAVEALDHLRYDNSRRRTLPRLQNASGSAPPAFERLGAEAAACHQLPCLVGNDDRKVLCPIAPKVQIRLLRAFAHAPDPTLHQHEAADPVPQAFCRSDINGLIAVIGPDTKASLAGRFLERQQLRLAEGFRCGRIDQGQPRLHEALHEIDLMGRVGPPDAGRHSAPAIRALAPLRQNRLAQPRLDPGEGLAPAGRIVGEADIGQLRRAARRQDEIVPRVDPLEPVRPGLLWTGGFATRGTLLTCGGQDQQGRPKAEGAGNGERRSRHRTGSYLFYPERPCLQREASVFFLVRAVLLRLVIALARMVVLVVVAGFLMGRAALPADLGRAAPVSPVAVLMALDAGVVGVAAVAFGAHDFFSCWRFWAPLPSLPCLAWVPRVFDPPWPSCGMPSGLVRVPGMFFVMVDILQNPILWVDGRLPADHHNPLTAVGEFDRLDAFRLRVLRLRILDDLHLHHVRGEGLVHLGDAQQGVGGKILDLLQELSKGLGHGMSPFPSQTDPAMGSSPQKAPGKPEARPDPATPQ